MAFMPSKVSPGFVIHSVSAAAPVGRLQGATCGRPVETMNPPALSIPVGGLAAVCALFPLLVVLAYLLHRFPDALAQYLDGIGAGFLDQFGDLAGIFDCGFEGFPG